MRAGGRSSTVSDAAGGSDATKRDRVELLATFLLAFAAVATAWSSYQATRWNGEQAKASSQTNGIRIQAARAASRAETETQVDVAIFIQWIDARASNDAALEDFYSQRFRDEFKPAFDAWIETNPFTNDRAPLSPFAMPQYRLKQATEAARLDDAAEASAAQVRRNIQRGGNYVLGVVLFSVALFFAGMSTRLRRQSLRVATLAMGCILFVGTALWIATFPVSVSV
jgi:hypothetical protein